MVAMDRALRGLGFARDVVVMTPEEFERDRKIPGTVARPAALEGKILYARHGTRLVARTGQWAQGADDAPTQLKRDTGKGFREAA